MTTEINPTNSSRSELKNITMLRIAQALAECSTCSRLSVGAVITDYDYRILSTGYNGRPTGMAHCDAINPHGDKEKCNCIHAEQNAIAYGTFSRDKKLAFVTAFPCGECIKLLSAINVTHVYYIDPYRYFESSAKVADDHNILYKRYDIGVSL